MTPKLDYMGLDYKVVAAVFVTLLAIAVGMKNPESGIGGLDIQIPGSIGEALDLGDRAIFSSDEAPNTSIEASFRSDKDSRKLDISDKSEKVRIKGRSAVVKVGGLEADVEEIDMRFINFTGKIEFEENLSVTGKAESMEFNSLPFTASEPKKVSAEILDPQVVSIDQLRSRKMGFSKVSGSFSQLDQKPASITSFEGFFARNYSSSTYSLKGKVFEAVFGEDDSRTVIGG